MQQHDSNAFRKFDYSQSIRSVIQNISSTQKFQIKIFLLFMLVSFITNFQLNSSHLFYMNPVFHCKGDPSQKVTEIDACQIIQFCTIINQETLTAELHLYCDQKKDDRVLIQSAIGIGNWCGIIFLFIISDRKGRKFCFCLSLFFLNIGCLRMNSLTKVQYIGVSKDQSILLMFAEIISAFVGKLVYINFLIMGARFFQKNRYETVVFLWMIVSACTNIIISIINSQFQNWRILFYIYMIGGFILSITSVFILQQDPLYYFDNGQYKNCKDVVITISNHNGTDPQTLQINLNQIDTFINAKTNSIDNHEIPHFNVFELVRCDIFLIIFILAIVGFFYIATGSSIDYSIQNLQLSYNQNILIMGISNIIGYTSITFLIKVQNKRKQGLLFASVICGIAGMMFAFKFCTQNAIIETIFLSISRISLCWIGSYYVLLKVDLFPEKYQGTLIGVVEFITNFGKVLGPIIVQLSLSNKINPIASISFLRVTIGTLPLFLLKQEKVRLNHSKQDHSVKGQELS